MDLPRPRLIISALKGGAGKTTASLSLAAAWRSQGLQVAPFKKGPDYIDAGWLGRAAGRTCRNLDPYLTGWDGVRRLFLGAAEEKTIALIEGNRGLYDGLDRTGSTSTAELAKRLEAPVVLVIDCTKTTRTIAALVYGCLKFDPEVDIAGVILNRVAGARHENLIRDCLADIGVKIYGIIPRFRRELPERHMGLIPPQEHPEAGRAVDWLAETGREHLYLDGLAAVAQDAPPMAISPPEPGEEVRASRSKDPVRIGVIQDSAFQFYYPENLEALERSGAEVVILSALTDTQLPPLDGLYIGGGFPETQAAVLADNAAFRRSVKEAAERGLPIYAECGGLMYLSDTLTMGERTYPMTGVLPFRIDVQKRPQGHGYTEVLVDRPNPFYPVGAVLRGHEFHYSRVIDLGGMEEALAFKMNRGVGIADGRDGVVKGNVLATYTHIHALGTPAWAAGLIARARERAGS